MQTSMSDFQAYRDVCRKAATDDAAFATFKRDPTYNLILEHVTEAEGQRYLDLLQAKWPKMLAKCAETFRDNDLQGGPVTFDYPGIGNFSPTTLRYIYVLADLVERFGALEGMNIVEIGGGYGGQCQIINSVFRPHSYTIIDLPEVALLQRRYLTYWAARVHCVSSPPPRQPPYPVDLVISNYAFTECHRTIQDQYLARILRLAARGYITGNFDGIYMGYPAMHSNDLLAAIPGSTKHKHEPEFCAGLYLLTWGEHGCPPCKTS